MSECENEVTEKTSAAGKRVDYPLGNGLGEGTARIPADNKSEPSKTPIKPRVAKSGPRRSRRKPNSKTYIPVTQEERDIDPRASGIPVRCAFDEVVDEAELKEWPRNPNKHPAEQLRLYGKVIKGNGWRRAIVVSNRSGFVTKGNGALQMARLHGLKWVPVDYQDYESDEAELQDVLADNELARYAVRDEAELERLVNELESKGVDSELAGLVKKLEETPELKPLQVVPPPKMAWVLIGVPLVKFGTISGLVEKIADVSEVVMESTVNDEEA